MHDSLDLRNLSKIKSAKTRRIANAVAAGSEIDLHVLYDLTSTIPPAEAALFLPALFVNVDSARIPDPSTLDSLLSGSSHIPSVYLGFESIRAISRLAAIGLVPVAVCRDLWPRIWNWLDFVHTYWDSIPMLVELGQETAIVAHSILLLAFDKDHETAKTMRSTPGVRRLLAAAWKRMIEGDLRTRDHAAFDIICDLLSVVSDSNDLESNFDEVLDGVGGDINDLASTIVRHLSRAHINPNPRSVYFFVRNGLSFLRVTPEIRGRLKATLQSVGFTATLITTISKLSGTLAVGAMDLCLFELTVALESPSSIALAIEAGLLRLVITLASSVTAADKDTDSRRTYTMIEELLHTQLPLSLMHYEVLSKLEPCFTETMEFAARSTIHTSAFRTQWESLSTTMKVCVDFFHLWEGQERPSFAACDNATCGKIDVKHNFKCCANCQSGNYCSEDCQSADWHAEHKALCKQLRSVRLKTPETRTTRAKSYLRALLTHDYQRLRADICLRQIFFMYRHPGEQFVTIFQYPAASQNVSVEVCRKRALETGELELAFARAARRCGRMELHIMKFFQGRTPRTIIFPMRTETTELHDRMVRVAQLIPSGMTSEDAIHQAGEAAETTGTPSSSTHPSAVGSGTSSGIWILHGILGAPNIYKIESAEAPTFLSFPGARASTSSFFGQTIVDSTCYPTFTFEQLAVGENRYRIIENTFGGILTAWGEYVEGGSVGMSLPSNAAQTWELRKFGGSMLAG
ncbi:hypothetical protein DFH06DRAFT_1472845 [Mycena polygramma]|nr:hypothetical protein DFH06DRAFT_1472845 [Mycena polygramma]